MSTEPPFPTLSAVSVAQSDELVFPVRVQPYAYCKPVILGAKFNGNAIKDAASAERFIAAIVQPNAHNTGWVRSCSDIGSNSRPSKTARRHSTISLM